MSSCRRELQTKGRRPRVPSVRVTSGVRIQIERRRSPAGRIARKSTPTGVGPFPARRAPNKKKDSGEQTPEPFSSCLARIQGASALLFRLRFVPGLDDVLGSFVSKSLNGLILGDFFRAVGDHGYFLGSCFFPLLDGDGGEAGQGAERRTDVSFASASDHAGHAGNVSDLLGHRHGGESENCHRKGCE